MKKSSVVGLNSYLLISSFLAGLFFNIAFYKQNGLGLAFPIWILLLIGLIETGKFIKDRKFSININDLLFLPVFLTSLVPFLTNSSGLVFWSVLISVTTLFLNSIYVAWDESLLNFTLLNNIQLYIYHFYGQFKGLQTFGNNVTFDTSHIQKHGSRLTAAFRRLAVALLISLPLICFYILLFSASDDIFNKLLSDINLPNVGFIGDVIEYFVILGIVAIIYCILSLGLFFYKKPNGNVLDQWVGVLDAITGTLISIFINIAFVTYVAIQFVYLFGGKEVAIDMGIVYSDYARRGFWEMLVIVITSFIVIYALKFFIVKKNTLAASALNISLGINLMFNIVIIFSSFKRLSLYVDAYGLTLTRFYVYASFAFLLIVLLYMVLLLTYETFAGLVKNSYSYAFKTTLLFIYILFQLTIFTLGVINPDAFVAKYNINRYDFKETIEADRINKNVLDVDYIIGLSSDGYYYLLKSDKLLLTNYHYCRLAAKWQNEKENRTIQTVNLYQITNSKELDKELTIFTNKDSYSSRCEDYSYFF